MFNTTHNTSYTLIFPRLFPCAIYSDRVVVTAYNILYKYLPVGSRYIHFYTYCTIIYFRSSFFQASSASGFIQVLFFTAYRITQHQINIGFFLFSMSKQKITISNQYPNKYMSFLKVPTVPGNG